MAGNENESRSLRGLTTPPGPQLSRPAARRFPLSALSWEPPASRLSPAYGGASAGYGVGASLGVLENSWHLLRGTTARRLGPDSSCGHGRRRLDHLESSPWRSWAAALRSGP